MKNLSASVIWLTLLFTDGFAQPFPLKVNGHYLVDDKDEPFLYHADTGWQLSWKLSKQETEAY